MSVEEMEDLKVALEQAQQEIEGLEHNLYDLTYEKYQLQYELKLKEEQIQKNSELALKRKRSTDGLPSATFNLDSHNQQLNDAAKEIERLKGWYNQALQDKRES